jgi:hypothetical protein
VRSNLSNLKAAVKEQAEAERVVSPAAGVHGGSSQWVAQAANSALRAAARGLNVALNGRPGAPGAAATAEAPAKALPAGAGAAGGGEAAAAMPAAAAGLAGAGGSEASLADSVSSHRAALPTTALRWMASGVSDAAATSSGGSFVGSGAPLGLPQHLAGGGGGGGAAGGEGKQA